MSGSTYRPILYQFVFLFCFGLLTLNAGAQEWKFPFSGKIEEFDEKKQKDVALEGAVISLYKSGSLQQQVNTPSNGKFKFVLEPNGEYQVTVTKNGYIMKKFDVNTSSVPEERASAGFGGMEITVGLFRTYPGLDYSCLNKPLAKISYNSSKDVEDFDYDKAYTATVQACIEKLRELERQAKLREKQYVDAMTRADKAFAAKQFEAAMADYKVALGIKAGDPPATEGIAKCQAELDKIAGANAANKAYTDAMGRGNAAMTAKNYEQAITEYKTALGLKPGDPDATSKISAAQAAWDAAKKAAENERLYTEAMTKADALFGQQKYTEAKAEYQNALKVKAGDAPATAGVSKCDAELLKIANKEKLEADYKAAMDKANGFFAQQKYNEAKAEYQKALALKSGDGPATEGVSKCDAELAKLAAKDKLEADYKAAMDKANGFFAQQKYNDAKAEYQKALALKSGDAPATEGVSKCDAELLKIANKEKLEADYKAAMDKANGFFAQQKYNEAKAEYQKALALKSGDGPATEGVSKCDAELAKLAAKDKLEADYKAAMAKANGLFGQKKFAEAKAEYQNALALKSGDQPAAEGVAKCDDELAKLAAKDKLEADYKAAMDKGNALFAEKKFEEAKTSYQAALNLKTNDQPAAAAIAKCDAELLKIANKEKLEADYKAAMDKANTLFAAAKFEEAKAEYNNALKLKTGDGPATEGVKKCDAEIKRLALEAEYKTAMASATELFGQQKFAEAKTQYQAALKAKPADQPATDGIAKCDVEIDKIRKSGELEKQYADAMKQGKANFDLKKYEAAKQFYTTASGLKQNEQEPKDKIKEIDGILADLEAQRKKDEEYKAAMTEAGGLFAQKKFAEAKSSYEKALGIKPGDQPATDGVNKCNAEIDKLAKGAEAEKNYQAAMTAGNAAFGGAKYEDALAKFQEALQYKPADATATAKVKETQGIINAAKAYAEAMQKAGELFAQQKFAEAKMQYQAALKAKPADQPATDGITKCDVEIEKIRKSGELEKQYADAMKQGKTNFDLKKYEAAKQFYTTASGLKQNEQEPKDKIKEIDGILADLEAQRKKDEEYKAAMTEAGGLFAQKKFAEAKSAYEKALGVKPGDQPATDGVNKCNAEIDKLAKGAEAEKNYQAAMTAGNTAFGGAKYEDALAKFQEALQYKPADATATAKVKETQGIINAAKAYAEAMKKADELFGQQKFAEAKTQYQAALKARAGDDLATQGVVKCDAELDKIRKSGELEKQYADAMKQGKANFDLKKYEDAKKFYTTASTLKPEQQDPKDRIKEIDDLLAKLMGEQELERKYKGFMDAGNTLFADKKYDQAKAEYNNALGVKANDAPALAAIKRCDEAIAKLGAEERFNAIVKEADQKFDVKNFAAAKEKYNEALALKSGDAYVKQRITECDKQLSLFEKDKAYIVALAAADSLYALANDEPTFIAARTAYKTASGMKPMEQMPKDKISEIDRKLDNLKVEKARRAKYDGLVTKADGMFGKKDYKGAKPVYKEALTLYPMELHPKQRLAEIERLLNPTASVKDTVKPPDKQQIVNDLVKKYPQGVTEVAETDPNCNCKITKRIVVKGAEAWVYTRKVFNWGGVYYFKDDANISENTFTQETKPTN